MGAALTGAVPGWGKEDDADGRHGWASYHAKDPGSAIHKRRQAAKDFWVD